MELELRSWKIYYSLGLIGLSIVLYILHYFIFYDVHHIFIYFLGDLAFLPIYTLIITLGLHEIQTRRERSVLVRKFNMVVSTFYSEVGSDLLNYLTKFDPDSKEISQMLLRGIQWSKKDFDNIKKELDDFDYCFNAENYNYPGFRDFLLEKRNFLLMLLENPTILEIKSFSDMLWKVLHLTEQLAKVNKLGDLSEEDLHTFNEHIKVTYIALVMEWLDYMKHLKDEFPFLFSLALRTNPFH